MLEPGVVLSERYRLDDRLGRGAMGDVWRATDLLLGRIVAVKVLLPALIDDPGFSKRFFAEARIMAALHHPGIVNVYDYGDSKLEGGLNAVYLVMECVDGEPLSAHMEAAGRLSVAETLSIVAQAASALQAAHDAEIVHRDVKPGNLLLSKEGQIRLADFGVARSGESVALTATNAVLGTARYMAPEQALGRPATAAADIYALGAVAYHCLAGVPPFQGETPIEVALHHVQDEPPPLPEGISPQVREMVSRAMAKDPAERFPSAAAFGAAAQALRSGNAADSTVPGSTAAFPVCADPAAHTTPSHGAAMHGTAVAGSLMHGPAAPIAGTPGAAGTTAAGAAAAGGAAAVGGAASAAAAGEAAPGVAAGSDRAVGPGSAAGPGLAAGHDAAAGPGLAAGHDAAAGPGLAAGAGLAAGPGTPAGHGVAAASGVAASGGGKTPTIRAAAAVPAAPGGGDDDTLSELLPAEESAGKRRRTTKLAAAGAGLLLALLATFIFADLGGERPTGSVTPTAPPTQQPSNVESAQRDSTDGRNTEPAQNTTAPQQTGQATTAPTAAPTTAAQTTPPVTETTPAPPATGDATPAPDDPADPDPLNPPGNPAPAQQDPAEPGTISNQSPAAPQGGPPPVYNPLEEATQ